MSCQLEWLSVLSHVSKGARANNCHGPGLALTRHCLPYTGWEIRSVGRFAPWTPLPRRTFSPLPTACVRYETRRYCYIASILMTAMQTRYTHTHTHTHPFNGPFSRTTRVGAQSANTPVHWGRRVQNWSGVECVRVCACVSLTYLPLCAAVCV